MNTKSELELVDVESAGVVEESTQVEMSQGDLDMVAGGATIAAFY
jgi:hypothetical protein